MGETVTTEPRTKTLETFEVSSGKILIIDQFMLGNDQFLTKLGKPSDFDKNKEAAEMYGGFVLEVPPGEFFVFRDPLKSMMLVCAESDVSGIVSKNDDGRFDIEEELLDEKFDQVLGSLGNSSPDARIFVDARCLVFVDAQILHNETLMSEYKTIRKRGDEKKARDFLRRNSAAIRYGFNKYGDELGLFKLSKGATIALTPDVVD